MFFIHAIINDDVLNIGKVYERHIVVYNVTSKSVGIASTTNHNTRICEGQAGRTHYTHFPGELHITLTNETDDVESSADDDGVGVSEACDDSISRHQEG